jgi:hypothetical protein
VSVAADTTPRDTRLDRRPRIITGIVERVDLEDQAFLVGTLLLRVPRRELIQGIKEGMHVRVRCEHGGEQTWAMAVTPVSP